MVQTYYVTINKIFVLHVFDNVLCPFFYPHTCTDQRENTHPHIIEWKWFINKALLTFGKILQVACTRTYTFMLKSMSKECPWMENIIYVRLQYFIP